MSEKIQTLEQKIAKRANDEVQKDIRLFRDSVAKAVHTLTGNRYYGNILFGAHGRASEYLRALLSGDDIGGGKWPSELWHAKEEQIRTQLIEQMDAMQRVLTVTREPQPDDATPAPETEPTTT